MITVIYFYVMDCLCLTAGPLLQGAAPELEGFGFELAALRQVPGTEAAVRAAAGIAFGHALAGQPDRFGHLGC